MNARVSIVALASVTLLLGIASARLTFHEAIWAQTAREMIASGDWLVPTIQGNPWLEKPPIGTWMIAFSGALLGGVTAASARLPSALAALAIALGVYALAERRLGSAIALLAGLIQATTPWLILRGRLAESDIVLAAIVVVAFAALDRVRMGSSRAVWVFLGCLGVSALAKGIGFGAAMIVASTLALLVWDRDLATFRALMNPVALSLAALIALAWPLRVLARHPQALGLWTMHVTDRLAAKSQHFAGEGWLEYLGTPLIQTLPWTPLVLVGAWISARRAFGWKSEISSGAGVPGRLLEKERAGTPVPRLDRLLWAWCLIPAAMVSTASTRNGHYLIHAMPPMAIWAAIGLAKLGERMASRRSWTDRRIRRSAVALFMMLGCAWGIAFLAIGPNLNARSDEIAFYERASKQIPPTEPLVLLYDLERDGGWDKAPYPSPFGPVPADLAARLFALNRPASWRRGIDDLRTHPPQSKTFAVIGREHDRAGLSRMGHVEVTAEGPSRRWDRAFVLYRVVEDRSITRRSDVSEPR